MSFDMMIKWCAWILRCHMLRWLRCRLLGWSSCGDQDIKALLLWSSVMLGAYLSRTTSYVKEHLARSMKISHQVVCLMIMSTFKSYLKHHQKKNQVSSKMVKSKLIWGKKPEASELWKRGNMKVCRVSVECLVFVNV